MEWELTAVVSLTVLALLIHVPSVGVTDLFVYEQTAYLLRAACGMVRML